MNITDEENIPNSVVQDYGEMMEADDSDTEQCQEEDNSTEQHHEDIESSDNEQCQEKGNSIEQHHENIHLSHHQFHFLLRH